MQVKKKSQLQEKRVAKDLNAKPVVASGALWGAKGDVKSDKFLVECKTTDKSFYSLSKNVWDKIRSEAIKDGLRIPVMCIELQGKSYAIIEKSMVEYYFYDNDIELNCVRVDKKSFRVKELPDERPMLFHINSWSRKLFTDLVQIDWEQFLEMNNEI